MRYELTSRFPNEEKFGLISLMCRAAVSIPSNLVGGQARRTIREFVQFNFHTEGSVAELDIQLTLSIELGFRSAPDATEADGLVQKLRKMLHAPRRQQLITHNFELKTFQ